MNELEESSFFTLQNGRYICDEEQSRVLSEIIKAHPFQSEEYKWDEMSMAELFAEIYRSNTLYCPEARSWFTYDGTKWKRDTDGLETMDRLMTFTKLLLIYSNEVYNPAQKDELTEYRKFLIKLSDRRSRERIIKDAQTAARVSIDRFDRDEYLINCQNGTYNLKTGKFKLHDAADYLTMITECKCPSDIDAVDFPRWQTFIDEITCGDVNVADYLQRALGYSLLGRIKEECMFIAYGKKTRNGKGTLFNTIEKILGDYAKAMPADFICKSRYGNGNYDRANPMLAGLKAKRFVTLSESDALGKLDEQAIKNFTGADPITTRNLHEKDFTFTPTFKIWLQCNTLPSVLDKSVFASDRLKVIEFNAHFDEERRDTTLKSQFLTEDAKTAIFKWLIDGYERYKKYGLAEPEAIKTSVRMYEKANDKVQMFIDEQCELGETYKVTTTELYNNYKIWCKNNNLFTLQSPQFKEQMANHVNLTAYRGTWMWKGIRIKIITVALT